MKPSLQDLVETYGAISGLANVFRHNNVTFDTERRENVAEHSYSLAVLGTALAQNLNSTNSKQLDLGLVAQFAVTHDLLEAYSADGDISVYASKDKLKAKKAAEAQALQKLEKVTAAFLWIAETIKEYERQEAPEAKFIYALDKLVVHMNVILSDSHHAQPTFQAYLRTEETARQKIATSYPELLPYFEGLCEIFRQKPHFFKDMPADYPSS